MLFSWPSWPNNSQPTNNSGWQAALLAKHTFALAGFLVMATENVYMQYEAREVGVGWGGEATVHPSAPR